MTSNLSKIAKNIEAQMTALLTVPEGKVLQSWDDTYPDVLKGLQQLRALPNGNLYARQWPFAPAVILCQQMVLRGTLDAKTRVKEVIKKYSPDVPVVGPEASAGGVQETSPEMVAGSSGGNTMGDKVGAGPGKGKGSGARVIVESAGYELTERSAAGAGAHQKDKAAFAVGGQGMGMGQTTKGDVRGLQQERNRQIALEGSLEAGRETSGSKTGKRKRPAVASPRKDDEEEEQENRAGTSKQVRDHKKKPRTDEETDTDDAALHYQSLDKGKGKGKGNAREATEDDEMEVDEITRPGDDDDDFDMHEGDPLVRNAPVAEDQDDDEDDDEDNDEDQDNRDDDSTLPPPRKPKGKPAPKKNTQNPPDDDEVVPAGAIRAPPPPRGKEATWKAKPFASVEINDPPCTICAGEANPGDGPIVCYKQLASTPGTTKKGKGREKIEAGACFYCAHGHNPCSLVVLRKKTAAEQTQEKKEAAEERKQRAEERKTGGKRGGTKRKSKKKTAPAEDLVETVRQLTERVEELEGARKKEMIAWELLELYKKLMDDNIRKILIAYASVRENLVEVMRHVALLGWQDNHLHNRINAILLGFDAALPEEYRAAKFQTCPEALRVKLTNGRVLETSGDVDSPKFGVFRTTGEDYGITPVGDWPAGMNRFPRIKPNEAIITSRTPLELQQRLPNASREQPPTPRRNQSSAVQGAIAPQPGPSGFSPGQRERVTAASVDSGPSRSTLVPNAPASTAAVVPSPPVTSTSTLNRNQPAPGTQRPQPVQPPSETTSMPNHPSTSTAPVHPIASAYKKFVPPHPSSSTQPAPGTSGTTAIPAATAPSGSTSIHPATAPSGSAIPAPAGSKPTMAGQRPCPITNPRVQTVSDPGSPSPVHPRPTGLSLTASISNAVPAAPAVAGPSSSQLSTRAIPPSSARDESSFSAFGTPLRQSPPPDVEMDNDEDAVPARGGGRGGRGGRSGCPRPAGRRKH
ncbi:hypothetical protein BJ165DRAFT_1528681 [Panaeolus papilionaceus]|nr:hypothetical protein BJ165DRAFT_1528681 [Panaeolus papilionaceus]